MNTLFSVLFVLVLLSLPVLGVILAVRVVMKKPIKKLRKGILICVVSLILLLILSVLTEPATWCNHEYTIIEEVVPTCSDRGRVVKKCSVCGNEGVEYTDMTPHSWIVDSVINATCTNGGHTVEKCEKCSTTQETNAMDALGHAMREVSRREPTYSAEGEIVRKCDRCEHKEVESIDKLELEVVKFNDLELTFGEYSFTEVDNRYSEHDGATVVRIPVTIKNVSRDPQALYSFYYKLFGTSGVESADIGYYFSDDVSLGGELLQDTSYTKYFHIVYDGDGVYTIVLDNFLYDKDTIKIEVKK